MSFVYPKGARTFFKAVENVAPGQAHFTTMFDTYYLCLMVGLDQRTLASAEELESTTFYFRYPPEHQPHADLIAGLLVDAELDRRGIASTDRKSIEALMIELLDPQSPIKLSDPGADLLNRYAAHGFEVIRQASPPPHAVEDFLLAYHRLWSVLEVVPVPV
jgi:hypothetical protein